MSVNIYKNGQLSSIEKENVITGVKGSAESTYRQGNVSLSAEDVDAKLRTVSFILLIDRWIKDVDQNVFSQTIIVPTLTAEDIVLVTTGYMTKAERDIYASLGIACVNHIGNTLIFESDEQPSIEIPITIVLQGGSN